MELQQTLEIQFEEPKENTEIMAKSIEEKVEDWAKKQFGSQKYYTKTESINSEIDDALRKAPSKRGGSGSNFPDIKCMIDVDARRIPVMIEVKGTQGALIKSDAMGAVENTTKKGEPNYSNITKYAVNGAVHYARAILDFAPSYKEVLAIGVNGYEQGTETKYEVSAWYISKDNWFVPKHVADYEDMSFLLKKNTHELVAKLDTLGLTDSEKEAQKRILENNIDVALKDLNQMLRDEQNIVVENRVQLVAGMIMAGLGTNGVMPLQIEDLQGLTDDDNDGQIILRKIKAFLTAKQLPQEKTDTIIGVLNVPFIQSDLQIPEEGESKLHIIYKEVKTKILPYLSGELHDLDFTGRLFNVMNDWVAVPDGDKNDVVLTPRYVTNLMAKLCNVNRDSFVWDFATGSAGFLISAMNEMIADAKANITSPSKLEEKVLKIKMEQLLGIEKLPDVYTLAVLNMILMKDGSANIIKDNSLNYDGTYKQGTNNGKPFPATVFLLNPPYSQEGKGLIFVDKALKMMNHGGRAAVLIQENAGSGAGLPYAANILKNNTLLASIKMADIFKGKANVPTAIYLFEVNRPHDEHNIVRFIDFSEDGYTRSNRKKASYKVNLRDTNHAEERYKEVEILAKYGKGIDGKNLHYFENCYKEDTISLKGNDWTYDKHKNVVMPPMRKDFVNVVKQYLSWRASKVLFANDELRSLQDYNFSELCLTTEESECIQKIESNECSSIELSADKLFFVKGNPQLNKENFIFAENAEYPYFTRTVKNNGFLGYVKYLDEAHKIDGKVLAVGMLGMQFFYVDHDYYSGQFTKSIRPKDFELDEALALWFISWFNQSSNYYKSLLVRDFEKAFNNTKITLPIDADGKIDFDLMRTYISAVKKIVIQDVRERMAKEYAAYQQVIEETE